MSDNTPIEWTDATVNAINGCDIVSPGCTNCYAMRSGARGLAHHPATGLTRPSKAGHVWTGEVRFSESALLQPLRWKRPRKIFWNAHGDMFHPKVPDEWIDRCFAVMALTPHHTHQVLTKRPERMREYLRLAEDRVMDRAFDHADMNWGRDEAERLYCIGNYRWPLPNVWLGVSVEDQQRADERIPTLLDTPAAVRWLSMEPLLGPVDLTMIQFPNDRGGMECWDALDLHSVPGEPLPVGHCTATIDWIVLGGESGPGERPMHPDWARSIRDQCAAAAVPFLFKQWGEFAPGEIAGEYLDPDKAAKGVSLFDGRWDDCWSEPDGHRDDEPDLYRIGKKRAGRLLDGVQHDGFPA